MRWILSVGIPRGRNKNSSASAKLLSGSRGNTPFVRPKKMDVVQRDRARPGELGAARKKMPGDPAAGKRDELGPAQAVGLRDRGQPLRRGAAGQFQVAGERNEFKISHAGRRPGSRLRK